MTVYVLCWFLVVSIELAFFLYLTMFLAFDLRASIECQELSIWVLGAVIHSVVIAGGFLAHGGGQEKK